MVWFVEYCPDTGYYTVYVYESGQYTIIACDDRYSNIQAQAEKQDAQIIWMGKKHTDICEV